MRNYFNENRNSSAESSIIRKTCAAACRARRKYIAKGTPEEVSKHFPAHSKVIACRLVHPFGDIDGHIAAALLTCNQSYILGVPSDEAAHTCLSGNISGESDTPSSQGAMTLAMKLRAKINAIKEQQSSYKAQVNQVITQMIETMNTMETELTAKKSQIAELTGRLSKAEVTIAELHQLSHLLEVTENPKSGAR